MGTYLCLLSPVPVPIGVILELADLQIAAGVIRIR